VRQQSQVLVRAGLVQQERTGRISRCRLDVGPIMRPRSGSTATASTGRSSSAFAAVLEDIDERKQSRVVQRKRRRTRWV
jgi:hypothetical protein